MGSTTPQDREETYLHHLNAYRQLLRTINDEMIKGEGMSALEPNEWSKKFIAGITNGMNSDTIIRHKWPEEKPEPWSWALIRRLNFFNEPEHRVAWYTEGGEWYVSGFYDHVDAITHWLELPEVTE